MKEIQQIDLSKIDVTKTGRTRDGDVYATTGTFDSLILLSKKVNELIYIVNEIRKEK
jgi:hypothetical protein